MLFDTLKKKGTLSGKTTGRTNAKPNLVSGFTLIELLVVIAIIGVLSSVILASLNNARSKSRDAKRLSEIKQLQLALDFYYDQYGYFPQSGWLYSYQSSWINGTNTLGVALQQFLNTLPIDPTNQSTAPTSSGLSYGYYANAYGDSVPSSSGSSWYMIVFKLENQNSKIDLEDGTRSTNNTLFDYGGNDGYIITYGRR